MSAPFIVLKRPPSEFEEQAHLSLIAGTIARVLADVARLNGETELSPIRLNELRRIAERAVRAVDGSVVMSAKAAAQMEFARDLRQRIDDVRRHYETYSHRHAIYEALDEAFAPLADAGDVRNKATVHGLLAAYEGVLEGVRQ